MLPCPIRMVPGTQHKVSRSYHIDKRKRSTHRSGFSLLEILLALAILGGSLAILSRVVETGTSAAVESRALSEARMVCQAKLSEVVLDAAAGINPLSELDVPIESFDSASSTPMTYSVEVTSAGLDGALSVRVRVNVLSSDGNVSVANVALTRWIVDPALELEQAEAEEKAAREAAVADRPAGPQDEDEA